MTIALVTQAKAGGLNGATTSSVDTTGATLLVMAVAYNTGSITVSDSKSNTWTALTAQSNGSMYVRLYYAANPTVGAGHTFTVSGSGLAPGFVASAWSGVVTSSPFDQQVGSGPVGTYTVSAPGADITPTENNEVIISCVSHAAAVTSYSAASGSTLVDYQAYSSGTNYGCGMVYRVQTTAATLSNSTAVSQWTTAVPLAQASASFKAAASGATTTTLTGPSSGTVGVASTNFTVGADGSITGTVTVTPSDGGGGGTFTPTSVAISSGTPTATFTYTPASTGAKSITLSNNGGLSNPSAWTYTSNAAGAPTSGTASLSSVTSSTINITCGAASSGTSPYTYQWYRSTTANFTPGAGNLLSGATSLTYADSASLSAGTTYYYKCRTTDNAAQTADSNQIAATLRAAAISVGFIGDSISYGYGLSAGEDPCSQAGILLAKTRTNKTVTVTNRAINGTKTADWASGGANLIAAKSAFSSASVTHVHIMLGANDAAAANLVSASTYLSNLSGICTDLTGAGYKVILSYPTYIPAGANSNATTAASVALAQSYQAQIDSLINGTTILRGDTLAWNYFQDTLSEYQSDQTHPTATGARSLATMWVRAIDAALAASGTSRTVSLTLTTDGSTPAASLTGLKWAFFDEVTPDDFAAPVSQGSVETTDGSGVLSLSVNTSLGSGATGWLIVTDSDGTTTQSPAHKAFSGPVTVT